MLTPSIPAVKDGKVFLVLRGELLNRFDPSPYKSNFYFKSNQYQTRKLIEIAAIDPRVTFNSLDEESEISFIPMDAIDDENGVVTKHFAKTINNSKGFTRFRENDLIWAKITPCMQNGKSAVVRNLLQGYGCGSTEFFVIRPKTTEVLVDYFHILLRDNRVLDTAQNFFGGSAGQQRVSKTFLENFPVPLPPLEIQHQIVQKMEAAYASKRAKEAEAAHLLASIDGYLLEQLGITLPEVTEKKKTFFVCLDKVSGGRFDPIYYTTVKDLIQQFKFELKKVRQVILNLDSGFGAGKQDQAENEKDGILQIRPTNISTDGQLKFDKNIFIPRESALRSMILENGDVLFNNTNSQELVGKTAYFDFEEEDFTFSNHITRIKVRNEIIAPQYLQVIFNFYQKHKIFYAICTNWNNQSGIGNELLLNLEIPIPPLTFQNEMISHISAIRTKAQQLEAEAKAVVEAAKKEVEAMILGEGGSV